MRVVVIGSTGPTGRLLVEDALAAGHEVTVLVRGSGPLEPASAPFLGRVRVERGDALDRAAVDRAFVGADAVLNAIGSGNRLLSRVGSRSAAVLVPAAEAAGIRRFVSLTALGAGPTARDLDWTQRSYSWTGLAPLLVDKARADARLRASGLDWTLVAAPALTNGPEVGIRRVGEHLPMRGYRAVSRRDTARFMVAELDDARWSRCTVEVSD